MKIDWSLAITLVIAFALGALVNQLITTGKFFPSNKISLSSSTGNPIRDYVSTHYPNAS